MLIYADFVPYHTRRYVTKYKLYAATHKYGDIYTIINDIGSEVKIRLSGCGWLSFRKWKIAER